MKLHIGFTLKSISLCVLIAVMMPFVCSHAETRVAERSVKKIPEWVRSQPTDYLVVIAYAPTLKDAQGIAEQELLRKVMMSIGVNVASETVADSGVEDDREWENFTSSLTLRAAKLPFLSGVTLANGEDSYWERLIDKSSGSESYAFYLLYPFDSSTRRGLIEKYEAYDSRMESSLAKLENGCGEVAAMEDLLLAEGELEALKDWFPDQERRKRTEKLMELYQGIRKSLVLKGEMIQPGVCQVRVVRGDKTFKVKGQLTATSNCASKINVKPDSDGWTVSFDAGDCLDYEDNMLKLTLRGTGLNLRATVSF